MKSNSKCNSVQFVKLPLSKVGERDRHERFTSKVQLQHARQRRERVPPRHQEDRTMAQPQARRLRRLFQSQTVCQTHEAESEGGVID